MPADHEDWWSDVPPQTIQTALTLAQTTWWVDSEATPHLVDSMTDRHRRAVLDYLALRSAELLLDTQETYARALPAGAPHRAAAALLVDQPDLASHREWLESTPLVRRLRELTIG